MIKSIPIVLLLFQMSIGMSQIKNSNIEFIKEPDSLKSSSKVEIISNHQSDIEGSSDSLNYFGLPKPELKLFSMQRTEINGTNNDSLVLPRSTLVPFSVHKRNDHN